MTRTDSYDLVFIGLTVTSSWGNGHATTYRGLIRELDKKGYSVLFLERDMPWYALHRDMPELPYGKVELYGSVQDLKNRFSRIVQDAELVVVGSFVPDGIAVGEWVQHQSRGICAFYDIDTPVTLSKLSRRENDYITPELVSGYDLYLSFAGGPTLDLLEGVYGAPVARALYCSVDSEQYQPLDVDKTYDLGYMGTFSPDRQESLELLMIEAAKRCSERKFVVAGPQYPAKIEWPQNIQRIEHIAPGDHPHFYSSQRFTLNLTRADMISAGYAPSVRLFEAAACGVPVISDYWDGLDQFFELESEILISRSWEQTVEIISQVSTQDSSNMGQRARNRVLEKHTAFHRAEELLFYMQEALQVKRKKYRNRNYVSRNV
ncbi:hypothetical protein CHISP_2864 [Chitinispirillum alkaliphilum]|nr:hypothetical protein CHISP_2864 [Chitinispirillum alkaliphilum]